MNEKKAKLHNEPICQKIENITENFNSRMNNMIQ